MRKIIITTILLLYTSFIAFGEDALWKDGVKQGGSTSGATIVELPDCSGISEGFCVSTVTGDLYYYDTASSSVQVVLTSVGNTPSYLNVRNTSGATITAGKFVKAAGSSGQKILIDLADNSDYEDADVIGYTWQSIGNNSNGTIISRGLSTNQSTAAWGIGDGSELYLGTLGVPVETKPTDAIATPVGTLVYANAGAGIVFVNPHHPIIGVPEAYSDAGYNGDYGAVTKDDIRDYLIQLDSDVDGVIDNGALDQELQDYVDLPNTANAIIGYDADGSIEAKTSIDADITISLTYDSVYGGDSGGDGSAIAIGENEVLRRISGGHLEGGNVTADLMDLADDFAFTGYVAAPIRGEAVGDGSEHSVFNGMAVYNVAGPTDHYLPKASTVKAAGFNFTFLPIYNDTLGKRTLHLSDTGDHFVLQSGQVLGDGTGIIMPATVRKITLTVWDNTTYRITGGDGTCIEGS